MNAVAKYILLFVVLLSIVTVFVQATECRDEIDGCTVVKPFCGGDAWKDEQQKCRQTCGLC